MENLFNGKLWKNDNKNVKKCDTIFVTICMAE